MNEAYSSYDLYPQLSYNIISNLLTNPSAEIIWKCLKYDTPDAWNMPNLTIKEKRELIYDGKNPNSTNYRVFIDDGQDDAIHTVQTILRIMPVALYPENRTIGTCAIVMDVMSHFKTNTMSNYQTKENTIVQSLLKCLNGANVESVGLMFFNVERCRACSVKRINVAPFKGMELVMAVNIGG